MAASGNMNEYRDVIVYPDLEKVDLVSADYYPSDVTPQDTIDAMDKFLKNITPFVEFAETAAFAIPVVGIFASSSIGLLWGAIQPAAQHKYEKPMAAIIGDIVESKLQSAVLVSARSSLAQFNGIFLTAIGRALPKSNDDVEHSWGIVAQFKQFVDAGLLSKAFDDIRDNLTEFNASAHMLLVSALEYIFQAHIVQIGTLAAIAIRARDQNDVHGYNKANVELCASIDRTLRHIPELRDAVKTKVATLRQVRLDGCLAQYNSIDANNITSHRFHSAAKYRTAGWVHDFASNRDLLRAELLQISDPEKVGDGVKSVGEIIVTWSALWNPIAKAYTAYKLVNPDDEGWNRRPDGSQDDDHFSLIMAEALKTYRKLLLNHIDEPFAKLLEGLDAVVLQAERRLNKQRLPITPDHGPVFISGKFVGGPSESQTTVQREKLESYLTGLNVGDEVSYRYTVLSAADELSSPWSPSEVHAQPGKLQQIYVGDGYAATEVTRRIYRRTSDNDAVGSLVDTIKGHGILTWPEDEYVENI